MDVNHILAREQIELALARGSLEAGARAAHQGRADRHRADLDDYREAGVRRAAAASDSPSAGEVS
jgi:hypothetical protein